MRFDAARQDVNLCSQYFPAFEHDVNCHASVLHQTNAFRAHVLLAFVKMTMSSDPSVTAKFAKACYWVGLNFCVNLIELMLLFVVKARNL